MSEIESLLKSGQTSLNLGNPKDALVFYQKVLDQDPTNLEALLKKGNIFGKFGKFEDAIICYDGVLVQEKENILALLNKGLCYHKIEQYNPAIECFDIVLKVKPDSKTGMYNMASSLIKSGKLTEGLELLSQLIKLDAAYKEQAKCDIDFIDIKNLNEFKAVTI